MDISDLEIFISEAQAAEKKTLTVELGLGLSGYKTKLSWLRDEGFTYQLSPDQTHALVNIDETTDLRKLKSFLKVSLGFSDKHMSFPIGKAFVHWVRASTDNTDDLIFTWQKIDALSYKASLGHYFYTLEGKSLYTLIDFTNFDEGIRTLDAEISRVNSQR